MAGPEAILGVISGGAGLLSLGIQLGESVVKLKRLHNDVKNAPKALERTIFDLETMTLSLRQLEQHRQFDNYGVDLLDRCILRCRQSTNDIVEVVEKMERYCARFRFGNVYIALKKDDLKDIFDDLEYAKSSLLIAYSMYVTEEQLRRQQQQSEVLVDLRDKGADMTRHLVAISTQQQLMTTKISYRSATSASGLTRVVKETTEETNDSSPVTKIPGRTRRRTVNNGRLVASVKIRLPLWLSSRVWELAIKKSTDGWDLPIRTYNIRPSTAQIFEVCAKGDLSGVLNLVQKGEASLLDQDESGYKLLSIAARAGRLDMCRYFLEHTVLPNYDEIASHSLAIYMYFNWTGQLESLGDLFEISEMLLGESSNSEGTVDEVLVTFNGSGQRWTLSQHIKVRSLLDLSSSTLDDRFETATSLLVAGNCSPADFLSIMRIGPKDSRLVSVKSEDGLSVLHQAAQYIVENKYCSTDNFTRDWLQIAESLILNGADPHAYVDETTPLMMMNSTFARIIDSYRPDTNAIKLKLLRSWAEMCMCAGLDLVQYGATENEYLSSYGGFGEQSLVTRWIFDAVPERWDAELCRRVKFRIFELQLAPGAFDVTLPRRITWSPTTTEELEGPWLEVEYFAADSAPFRLSAPCDGWDGMSSGDGEPPFASLVKFAQDDTGFVSRMLQNSHRPKFLRRSYSQPPLLRRREIEYLSLWDVRASSSSRYHLCPRDGRFRFGCCDSAFLHDLKDNLLHSIVDVRRCMKGMSESEDETFLNYTSEVRHWACKMDSVFDSEPSD